MPRVWSLIKLRRMRERGFSPVELLLAATVFGMLVTTLIGAIVYGRESTADAGERARAMLLAEEGIEAVRNIGNASFANLVDTGTSTNIGNTTVETGSDSNPNGSSAFKVSSGTTSGAVSSVSIYLKTIDATNNSVQAAIYADNGSGTAPTTRLGVSSVQTAVANSWNTFAISGVTITASTTYWIALSENGSTFFANNSSGGFSAYRVTGGYPAPNPFAADSANTVDKPSFYMTVSSGGSTTGISQGTSPVQWNFSGTATDTTGIFTRSITITTPSANRKKVTCTVSWPHGSGTSQVSAETYLSNWTAAIAPTITPGPIMMAYSKTTTTPFYRTWNGTTWSAEGSAQAVVGNVNYVVLKSSRTRNEAILGVQTSTGAIYIQTWNGTSWGNLTQVGTGPTTTRSFDISYEKNSDRAMIAYSSGADFAYRIWDGATLSAATTVTAPPTTGTLNWLELDHNPLSTSNDIAMIMLDANADVYGMVWTGSAWSNMSTTGVWDATAASASKKAIDVEYEQTSGKAMFMWGDSVATDQYYRTWNGSALSGATLLDIAAEGGLAEWIQLAARPNSNEILLGVQDAGADLNTRKWSGSAWDTATQHAEHSAITESILSRNFDIVWETHTSNPGKAWLVWGDSTAGANAGTVMSKQWSGTAWGSSSTMSGSDDTSFVRLRADPVSGVVFAGIYQNSTSAAGAQDINERRLTGGGSTWSAKNQIWGGPTGADPVFFRIDIAAPE